MQKEKFILFLLFLSLSLATVYAQESENEEGINKKNDFLDKRRDPDGSFRSAANALLNYWEYPFECTDAGEWQAIGPLELKTQHAGIIASLYIDKNNPDFILAGSNGGGLWKTTNGGINWTCLTENAHLPGIGVLAIAADPNDLETIYIATGVNDIGRGGYGLGVLKTTDGGLSWKQANGPLAFTPEQTRIVQELKMHPDIAAKLYALSYKKIYTTTNAGKTWQQDTIPSTKKTLQLLDIDFLPGASNTMYVSGTGAISEGGGEVWRSFDGGITWNNLTPAITTDSIQRIAVAFTPAEPHAIYAIYNRFINGTNYAYFKKSLDDGNTWSLLSVTNASNDFILMGGLSHSKMELEISPVDPNIIYVGSNVMNKSTDGGHTFKQISDYFGNTSHADVRALQILSGSPGGNQDVVIMGNDGGISKTYNGGTSWKDLNGNGLNITQFFGLAGSESEPDLIIGGCQDNSTLVYSNGEWNKRNGGDGGHCLIDYSNPSIMYGSSNGSFDKSTNMGIDWSGINPKNLTAKKYDMRLQMHPTDPNTIYVAWYDVWKTTNGGNPFFWEAISNQQSKPIEALAVAPSNPNYIYFSANGIQWNSNPIGKVGVMWKTTDGGKTWTDITEGLEALHWSGVTDIVVSPTDPNKLWVSFDRFWVYKVMMSTDGGAHWTNYSDGLKEEGINFPVNCLVYEKESNDRLYAGTDVGVFYRSASMPKWECFSGNLPTVVVTDLDINYATNSLRASTYGRGIWQSPLFCPPAQDISLEGSGIGNNYVETSSDIISHAEINAGTTAIYRAGDDIVLTDGFVANAGSDFHAFIEPCEKQTGKNKKATAPVEKEITKEIPPIDQENKIDISPNPANGKFMLSVKSSIPASREKPLEIKVYDVLGKEVLQQTAVSGSAWEMDISTSPKGVYIIKVKNDNNLQVEKIVNN